MFAKANFISGRKDLDGNSDEMLLFLSSLSSFPPELCRLLLSLTSEYWHCLDGALNGPLFFLSLFLNFLRQFFDLNATSAQMMPVPKNTMRTVKLPGPRDWEQHNTLQGAPHPREKANPPGEVTLGDCEASTTSISPFPAFRAYEGGQWVCGSLQQSQYGFLWRKLSLWIDFSLVLHSAIRVGDTPLSFESGSVRTI